MSDTKIKEFATVLYALQSQGPHSRHDFESLIRKHLEGEWISVKDQPPPEKTTLLLCWPERTCALGYYNHGALQAIGHTDESLARVTHYSLPQPPLGGGK